MPRHSILIFLVLLPTSVFALDTKFSRQSLKGIPGLNVVVEQAEGGTQHVEVDTAKIKAAVEGKLKGAGIKILTEEERPKAPGGPYLSVNLNAIKGKDGTVSFGLSLVVFQACRLERDQNTKLQSCDTWSKNKVGHANSKVPEYIAELVNGEVDVFLKAYAEVNPHGK